MVQIGYVTEDDIRVSLGAGMQCLHWLQTEMWLEESSLNCGLPGFGQVMETLESHGFPIVKPRLGNCGKWAQPHLTSPLPALLRIRPPHVFSNSPYPSQKLLLVPTTSSLRPIFLSPPFCARYNKHKSWKISAIFCVNFQKTLLQPVYLYMYAIFESPPFHFMDHVHFRVS